MLSINANNPACPPGTPCSIVDTDTGQIIACHRSVVDAAQHLRLLESDVREISDADIITGGPVDLGDVADLSDFDDPDSADPDSADPDVGDDEDDDPTYCVLCGSDEHDEDDHDDGDDLPDDGDESINGIGESGSGIRAQRNRIDDQLIRLGAPPRENTRLRLG
jgi:hypothetical protein